ncbi:hypothetical protein [Streptomyces sp. NPDC057939]|uniref:hypothetical protein n=1 Tax=Streptomyces sp. NPDC057939 TaxID=3346284 RepID=UPI0036EFB5F2
MSITSPIPVLQGDQGIELRSEGPELLLRRPEDEVRIPLAAIARVHAEGRVVAVELTAEAGAEPVLYRIENVSRAAGGAFADAVNGTLPERAAGEETIDGSTLVTVRRLRHADGDCDGGDEEDEEVRGRRWTHYKWATCVVGAALVAFSVVVAFAGEDVGRAVAVLLVGAVGAMFTLAVASTLGFAWDNWYLPRHGITVEAQPAWIGGRATHAYTDTSGNTHPYDGSSSDAGGATRVAYHPRRPNQAVRCEGRGRQVKDLSVSLIVFCVAAPVVYGSIALALPAFDR